MFSVGQPSAVTATNQSNAITTHPNAIATHPKLSKMLGHESLKDVRYLDEDYHKILKSGCRIEECRLESTPGMKRYIALFCIIGWRLFWLNRCYRQNPQMPSSSFEY